MLSWMFIAIGVCSAVYTALRFRTMLRDAASAPERAIARIDASLGLVFVFSALAAAYGLRN